MTLSFAFILSFSILKLETRKRIMKMPISSIPSVLIYTDSSKLDANIANVVLFLFLINSTNRKKDKVEKAMNGRSGAPWVLDHM
jgi:hypothetical protein